MNTDLLMYKLSKYQYLLSINPSNGVYKAKIQYYENKNMQEQAKEQQVTFLIGRYFQNSYVFDFSKVLTWELVHKITMNLIQNLSTKELKHNEIPLLFWDRDKLQIMKYTNRKNVRT